MAHFTARVIDIARELPVLLGVAQHIHQPLIVFFELGYLDHVCTWRAAFLLEVERLDLILLTLQLVSHQLDLGDLGLNLLLECRLFVSVLLVCLLKRFYALFLELKLHFDLFKVFLLIFVPLHVSRLSILKRVTL